MAKEVLKPGEYYGSISRKSRCSGLTLIELAHAKPRRMPTHSHESAFYSLLLTGNYSESLGRRTIAYKPLTMMFHPAGTIHRDEIGLSGAHFFNIEMERQWLDQLRESSATLVDVADLEGGELVWLTTRLYREYLEMDEFSPLAIEGLVLEMLAVTARSNSKREKRRPPWLLRLTDKLRAEFQQSLTVSQLAKEVGMHPFHLSRVFRSSFQQGIGEYVRRLRIQFACSQLSNGDIKLADIALLSGFADQSHFNRVFKRITGMTPKQYRDLSISSQIRLRDLVADQPTSSRHVISQPWRDGREHPTSHLGES